MIKGTLLSLRPRNVVVTAELLEGCYVQIKQAGEGKINLLDFFDGEFLDDTRELFEFIGQQRHRSVCAQPGPVRPCEDAVGRKNQIAILRVGWDNEPLLSLTRRNTRLVLPFAALCPALLNWTHGKRTLPCEGYDLERAAFSA